MRTKRKLVMVDDDFHTHTFDGDPEIELLKWRGVKKPTGLRGFATVDFHGLILPNMPVMITAEGERWVGLPGRRLLRATPNRSRGQSWRPSSQNTGNVP